MPALSRSARTPRVPLAMSAVALALLVLVANASGAHGQEQRARYIAAGPAEEQQLRPTPVPILKQVNRHNEDGSYTYGFEAADGSFKIETKEAHGEVRGKYGYTDDTGKVRVIEYGANKYGFQPAGEGITVAPPTLVDESTAKGQSANQFAEQQQADYDYEEPARPAPAHVAYRQRAPAPAPAPAPVYRPAPVAHAAPAPRPPRPQFFPGAAPVQDEGKYFRPAAQPSQPLQQLQQLQARPHSTQHQQLFTRAGLSESQSQPQSLQYTQAIDFSAPTHYREQPRELEYARAPPPAPELPAAGQYAPARYEPQPQYSSAPVPRAAARPPPFTMLDQLIKEYGLPQNSAAPLHDITFGSY